MIQTYSIFKIIKYAFQCNCIGKQNNMFNTIKLLLVYMYNNLIIIPSKKGHRY